MFIIEIDRGQTLDSFELFALHLSCYNEKTKVYKNITTWEELKNIWLNGTNLGIDNFKELYRI